MRSGVKVGRETECAQVGNGMFGSERERSFDSNNRGVQVPRSQTPYLEAERFTGEHLWGCYNSCWEPVVRRWHAQVTGGTASSHCGEQRHCGTDGRISSWKTNINCVHLTHCSWALQGCPFFLRNRHFCFIIIHNRGPGCPPELVGSSYLHLSVKNWFRKSVCRSCIHLQGVRLPAALG